MKRHWDLNWELALLRPNVAGNRWPSHLNKWSASFSGIFEAEESAAENDRVQTLYPARASIASATGVETAVDTTETGNLKGHEIFPMGSFPPWLHPVKIWLQTVSG